MTSKPASKETITGTRDQNDSQGMAHNRIATRSRLALPEFNVEYDRSPLKNAREALRRANARYGKSAASAGTSADEGSEGKVDAKMNDVLARVNINAASNPFRRNDAGKYNASERDEEPKETGDAAGEDVARTSADRIDGSTSMLQPPTNRFDFRDDTNDGYPKYPKRARSSSFDENTPPSPSGSDHSVGRMPISRATPPLSPSRRPVAIDSTTKSGVESVNSAALSSSVATIGINNPKRAKLGKQGTLDTFFARPSSSTPVSSQAKEKQPESQRGDVSPTRRFFSEASPGPSVRPDSNFTPPTNNSNPTHVEEAIVYPKTPTLKHLRELPSLDLRKITPSPRKPALKIGLGTPGRKQPLKTRAISEGSALLNDLASEGDEQTGAPKAETKEGDKRSIQGSIKDKEDAQLLQAQPRIPKTTPPSEPLTSPEEKPITQAMEVDADSHTVESGNAEAQVTVENALPSITVSTSTGTIAYAGSPVKENLKPEPAPPVSLSNAVGDDPSTPQDKILPSRPLPSGRLPSTKSHLSHLLSLSPLTPLSALGPLRESSGGYDYGEEEKAVREETSRLASREAAKLAMQEEAEADADNEDISATPKPLPKFPKMSSPKKSSPAPAGVLRKGSNKGKDKAKLLSTTSRLSTGVSGIKKRGSFVSVSGGLTPRMRMTRAAVLRQKAIQARTPVRTPKDAKKRRTSIFAASVSSTIRKADEQSKDKEVPKAGQSSDTTKQPEQQKRPAEPEPQRSPRKTFILTVPSSLSPRKSRSVSSSADSSLTLKSKPLESGPSKPFTFSLYPPSLHDTATTEQAQRALHKLSSALDKLNMPPPPKPSGAGAQLKRPMSEQRERIRSATSLGFTRESSVPVTMSRSKEMERPRGTSRAGSAEPTKKSFFPPPPPPAFGSSLQKDRGKGKALANSSRTAPAAFVGNISGQASQIRPPSSFRFGLGSSAGTTGIFQRPVPRMRASQKPSLETVQGSPVKGAGNPQSLVEDDEDEIVVADGNDEQRDTSGDADASASSSNANGDTSVSSMEGSDTPGAKNVSDGTSMNGKELKKISRLNASRRASMAFTALAESLGTSPDMFSRFGLKQPNTSKSPPDEKTPTGSTTKNDGQATDPPSSNTNRPLRAAAPRSFGFNATRLGRTQSESSVNRSARQRSVTPSGRSESDTDGGTRPGSKKSASGATWRSKMEGSHDALNHCVVFVDVKSDEGEDAGVLFVDMLRALGAKVLSSVGQTLTHIVYKNGMTSTLNRYRLLDEPRPKVVGINWVVECAEAKAHVDETRFLVDLESVNVAGVLKRRRSFLPKQITSACASGPMDAFLNGSGGEPSRVSNSVPKACADSDVTSEDGDTSQERVILSGGSLTSDMHPLERARKRNAANAR